MDKVGNIVYRTLNGGGLHTPGSAALEYSDEGGGWTEWDKKAMGGPRSPPIVGKEGGMVVNNTPNVIEEVPTSRSRRWWLYIVWGLIPPFPLTTTLAPLAGPRLNPLVWMTQMYCFVSLWV